MCFFSVAIDALSTDEEPTHAGYEEQLDDGPVGSQEDSGAEHSGDDPSDGRFLPVGCQLQLLWRGLNTVRIVP